MLKAYPSAQDVAKAGVEAVYQVLHSVPAAHFGRPTAKKLVAAAQISIGSGRALTGRASSLRILCDQLEHTQANLTRLEAELEQLITMDPGTKGLQQMPELGPKSVAVLRGCRDQRERPVERESQALQARQWLIASNPLPRCPAQYSPGRLRLWSVLSSSGGARVEENVRYHGRHAQNGNGSYPSDENG